MNIILYHNTIPLNHAARNLSQSATLTGTLREGCNILNPDIRVNYNVGYLQCNYAYIADFGRYYYFREPPTIEGDIMTIKLHADALYNYLQTIMKSQCIAERSSSKFNLYLADPALNGETKYHYFSRAFTGGHEFTPEQGTYILSVAGR